MRGVTKCQKSLVTVDFSDAHCGRPATRWIMLVPVSTNGTDSKPGVLESYCDECFPHRTLMAFIKDRVPVLEFTREQALVWEVMES